MKRLTSSALLGAAVLFASAGCNPATVSPCDLQCGDHGFCALSGGTPRCVCEAGYQLTSGACEVIPSVCANVSCGNGKCVDANGSPLCICDPGYVVSNSSCIPVTPEPDPCEKVTCGGHGACAVASKTAVCICEAGFVPKGTDCVAGVNPCDGIDCSAHGFCAVMSSSTPVCVCESGYSSQGTACIAGQNACQNVTCGGHGLCAVTAGGTALCVCEEGYQASGLDCAKVASPCDGVTCNSHGACVVGAESQPVCVCDAGFYRSGTSCVANIDPCSGNDCGGHGACALMTNGNPVCICEPGYAAAGATCAVAVDPCATVDCSGHGSCTPSSAGPLCICDPGFHAQGSACLADPDPCLAIACSLHGNCVATSSSALCICDSGYRAVGLECIASPFGVLPETADSLVAPEAHPEVAREYIPNELLVFAKTGHDATALQLQIASLAGTAVAYQPAARRYIVRFDPSTSFALFSQAKSSLAASSQVSVVVENWISRPKGWPNDPGWGTGASWDEAAPGGSNWFMEAIHAFSVWQTQAPSAARVRIGIIDWGNPAITDLRIVSRNTCLASGLCDGADPHGTQVARVAAALGNNGEGTTGVLWNADIYYCQFNGSWVRFGDCFDWLWRQDVRIINFSSGTDRRKDPGLLSLKYPWQGDYLTGQPPEVDPVVVQSALGDVLAYNNLFSNYLGKPWVFVQSAGNDALDEAWLGATTLGLVQWNAAWLGGLGQGAVPMLPFANAVSPEMKQRVIVVGATGSSSPPSLAAYSNKGPVQLLAPGGDGINGGEDLDAISPHLAGTSFAAPMVAATAALAWSIDPSLTPQEIVANVVDGSEDSGVLITDSRGNVAPRLDVASVVARVKAGCAAKQLTFNPLSGQCVACVPSCTAKVCGAPDGCLGFCSGIEQQSCSGEVLNYCEGGTAKTFDCATIGAKCVDFRCAKTSSTHTAPTGAIVAPLDGAVITGSFAVSVGADDDIGLTELTVEVLDIGGVRFRESKTVTGTSAQWTTSSIDTTTWAPGAYFLRLGVSDGTFITDVQQTFHVVAPIAPTCSVDHWCWDNPTPHAITSTLRAAWTAGPSDVWAVGDGGTILHWNGTAWSNVASSTTQTLWAIWGRSPTDIWAVGSSGTIVRWNGSMWSAVPSGLVSGQHLYGIWGSSSSDLWVVGAGGLLRHWDGSQWANVSSGTTSALRGIWGAASNDIWMVGGTSTYHWDGSAWTSVPSGSSTPLEAIWGAGPNDIWAVGGYSAAGQVVTTVYLHWDGTAWSKISGPSSSLLGVWGTSSTDVWTVGYYRDMSGNESGHFNHWDGVKWTQMGAPSGFVTPSDLFALTGSRPDDVWAVGVGGIRLQWNGLSWRHSSGPTVQFESIRGLGANDVYAVGAAGTIVRQNGTKWLPMPSGTTGALTDVWGTSSSDLWTGAGRHWDGYSWSTITSPIGTHLWGDGSGVIWSVGTAGTNGRWNGNSWMSVPSGTTSALYDVWGSSGSNIWAVGAAGTVVRFDGSAWSAGTSGTAKPLYAVWGTSGSDIWAVGDTGTIIHYDGSSWSAATSWTTTNLRGVWGSGPSDVWAVGYGGAIHHWDGTSWIGKQSGTTNNLLSVWSAGPNQVWAVGAGGTILSYRP